MGRQAIDGAAQSGILPRCTGAPSTGLRPQDATAARVRGVAPQNMENEMSDQTSPGDPRTDALRAKMTVTEDPQFSREYHDPDKRSIASAVEVFFNDGRSAGKLAVEYPLGHRRRRAEGFTLLKQELLNALRTRFPESRAKHVHDLCLKAERLQATSVNAFSDLFAV